MSVKVRARAQEPVRDQLRSILVAEIDRGPYWGGTKLPSERKLAETYGTSRTSVRQALECLVQEGILIRSAGKGTFVAEGYKPAPPGEGGGRAETRTLAFVVSEEIFHFVEPGINRILVEAQRTCQERGSRLLFQAVNEAAFQIEGSADGCIVVGGAPARLLDQLRAAGTPVVLVDLLQDDSSAQIGFDYAGGMRQAMTYLHGLGHRQIGFVGFPNTEKYVGYWQSLATLGLGYDPQLVAFLQLPDLAPSILSGYRTMQKMLAAGRLPTAMIATNDLVAYGMMDALAVAGIGVPERLSVVGFDDLGRDMNPPLTTVRSHAGQAGTLAVGVLLEWIESGGESPGRITVPTELVIRTSTAPPQEELERAGK
jgi:DNA-binding LacI/PurR family transcriptional regulator